MGRLARKAADFEVDSNLGISANLRVSVPAHRSSLAFGRPGNNPTERLSLLLCKILAAHCDDFIDVGANYGVYAMQASLLYRMVHALEPDEILFECLQSNIRRNNARITPNRMAVSDKPGPTVFYRDLSGDSMGSIRNIYSGKHQLLETWVESIALADYLMDHDIMRAFIKIDVEGAGSEVWSGLRRAVDRVQFLIVEVTGPEAREDLQRRIILDSGFHAYFSFTMRQSIHKMVHSRTSRPSGIGCFAESPEGDFASFCAPLPFVSLRK